MADTRERSRSPDPDPQQQNGDSAPHADTSGAQDNTHGDAGEGEGVKLYVGNLDYGTLR
jgi:hypothetical protein